MMVNIKSILAGLTSEKFKNVCPFFLDFRCPLGDRCVWVYPCIEFMRSGSHSAEGCALPHVSMPCLDQLSGRLCRFPPGAKHQWLQEHQDSPEWREFTILQQANSYGLMALKALKEGKGVPDVGI